MSIVSSSRSSVSQPGSGKVVRFQLNYNLKSLLLDFVNEKDRKLYEELICHIRDLGQEIRDDDLAQLLREARGCISILDRNFRLFVQVVLILRWTHRSEEVVNEYKGFLQDLCSAHNYYTKIVLDHLVSTFKNDTEEWEEGGNNEKSVTNFNHIHQVINSILVVIPMSKELLVVTVQSCYPYFKRPAKEHEAFVYNVLQICNYVPQLRNELLKILVLKVITLDVHSPRKELENLNEMEVDGVFPFEEAQANTVSHSLDLVMSVMFKYIHSECYKDDAIQLDKLKALYSDFIKIFDAAILPTHSIHHVQFLLFYLLGLKPPLIQAFLKFLWAKLSIPCVPSVIRQTAVCYIASLLARAKFISVITVQEMLTEMANWIHSYIGNQDESGNVTCDTRVHGVFYATCQSLFYVIAFRYKELIQNKGLVLLQGLNLSKIITCRLNPLKACLPVIVSHFASVARAYQLAYCYTVIERNARSTLPQVYRDSTGATTTVSSVHLDTFFPFDPYLLTKSKSFIEPFYREYSGPDDTDVSDIVQQTENDEDDFLETETTQEQSTISAFSYSSSPGFLHCN